MAAAEQGMRWRGRVVVNQGGAITRLASAMTAPYQKLFGCITRAQPADGSGNKDDDRKGYIQEVDCYKTAGCNRPQDGRRGWILQCFTADAVHRLHDQRCNGWLDAVKQARHPGHAAERDINPAQANQDEE
jgi:hypothetical protein